MKRLFLLLFMAAAAPASAQWFVQMHLNGTRIGQTEPYQSSVFPFGYGLFGGLTVSPKVLFYGGINAAFLGRDKYTATAEARYASSQLPDLPIVVERKCRNISPELRLRYYIIGDVETDFSVFAGAGVAREFISYTTTAVEQFNQDDYLLFLKYNNTSINLLSGGGGSPDDITKVFLNTFTVSAGAEKLVGGSFWLTGAVNYRRPLIESNSFSTGSRVIKNSIALELGLRANL